MISVFAAMVAVITATFTVFAAPVMAPPVTRVNTT